MRYLLLGVAALGLVACGPSIPDSGVRVVDAGSGVGFDSPAARAARDAQLEGRLSPATEVQSSPLDGTAEDEFGVPPEASAANRPPQVVSNAAGISSENDFDAVSAERGIEDDAMLIAQNRAQYQVIAPTELPTRPGSDRPNIVEYALRTDNPVGTSLYRRLRPSQSRYERACAGYTSADLAQEEFLASGGPQRDRRGVDPDGDGFACSWDPAPFRAARG